MGFSGFPWDFQDSHGIFGISKIFIGFPRFHGFSLDLQDFHWIRDPENPLLLRCLFHFQRDSCNN